MRYKNEYVAFSISFLPLSVFLSLVSGRLGRGMDMCVCVREREREREIENAFTGTDCCILSYFFGILYMYLRTYTPAPRLSLARTTGPSSLWYALFNAIAYLPLLSFPK